MTVSMRAFANVMRDTCPTDAVGRYSQFHLDFPTFKALAL